MVQKSGITGLAGCLEYTTMILNQFGDKQHDGAPVISKWLWEQSIKILGPWPGNCPDLNPIENWLEEVGGQTKTHIF